MVTVWHPKLNTVVYSSSYAVFLIQTLESSSVNITVLPSTGYNRKGVF